MAPIVLYGADFSCSMVAYSLLTEFGVPFVDFRMRVGANGIEAVDGSMDRAAYVAKVHPSGYVPALALEDGQIVTENPAIFRWISGQAPARNILGRTIIEQVRCEEWLVWLCGTLHGTGYGALWRPERFAEDEAMFEAVKAKAMKTIRKCYDRIEEKVVGPYALGEQWTVIDVFLHTFWRWAEKIGLELDSYPRLKGVVKEIEKLPGLRKAMAVEGKALYFS